MRVFAAGFAMAFAVALIMTVAPSTKLHAQTLTPDMMAPTQGGFAPLNQSPLRKTADAANAGDTAGTLRDSIAPSRIGAIPVYGVPAASGASDSGYDSLNRTRKKPKPYPGAPKPKFVGPGNPAIALPPPPKVTAPVAPALAGTVAGQPPRRRLKVDGDPFGNVGFYTGTFLTKTAIELSGGYDTNPGRIDTPKGSAFYVISPELLMTSDWERHSVIVDLRGSFTGYGATFPSDINSVSPVPTSIDRPDFTGKVDGRLDVSHDTRINSEARLRVGTDNPGSPNVQVGLAKYPLYATSGGTLGVEQDFSRLQVSLAGTLDHTAYQYSKLTDGTTSSNDDRNFDQYGGIARVSYDLTPGIKPFAEFEADTRVHQLQFDRSGFERDSTGGYLKGGTTFEFSRLLTGDMAIGYGLRNYQDPRLNRLQGLLTSGSLVWTATGLTTVRLNATSSIDETTLPFASGSLSRDYALTVDHAFRRWLIGSLKGGYGTTDYDGERQDKRYYVEGDLIYKLSRTFQIKGSVRRDWLDSNVPGASAAGTVVMLGVRIQR
ncbi:MAG: outer membrane beta-barrel protein [Xanthobacteraceae bacterium]|nr:outer membrane beta-barrel protein [Xanthobacteraceae bacterium]